MSAPRLLVGAYCRLALQDEANKLGLTSRACLVEHMSEVCPYRCQRDAETAGGGLQPIAFRYLDREYSFCPGQPKILAEPIAAEHGSLFRFGDK